MKSRSIEKKEVRNVSILVQCTDGKTRIMPPIYKESHNDAYGLMGEATANNLAYSQIKSRLVQIKK